MDIDAQSLGLNRLNAGPSFPTRRPMTMKLAARRGVGPRMVATVLRRMRLKGVFADLVCDALHHERVLLQHLMRAPKTSRPTKYLEGATETDGGEQPPAAGVDSLAEMGSW